MERLARAEKLKIGQQNLGLETLKAKVKMACICYGLTYESSLILLKHFKDHGEDA